MADIVNDKVKYEKGKIERQITFKDENGGKVKESIEYEKGKKPKLTGYERGK